MEPYGQLLELVLLDNPCDVGGRSLRADVDYLRRRLSSEGLPFVLTGLRAFAKALEAALESGKYQVPNGFRRSVRNPGLPAFMQDVLLILFDKDGVIREEIDWLDQPLGQDLTPEAASASSFHGRVAKAVAHVRQVGNMFYKLELPYPPEVQEKKLDDWFATEESLPEPEHEYDNSDGFSDDVSYEIERLLDGVSLTDIHPRHGPGAVSTGEKGDDKWAFKRTYNSLTPLYPLTYFTVGGEAAVALRDEWRNGFDHHDCGISRLIFVFKDATGPRGITPEPPEFQWIQQGQGRVISEAAHRRSFGRINFRDQSINGRLALSSSLTRRDATLDMKDASDNVTVAHVKQHFPARLVPHMLASRSEMTMTPRGVVRIKKFAGMGSAMCFPVEAIFFWAVSVVAIARAKPGRKRWARLHVYTFGDDLIVPREYAHVVMAALERYGLKVNRSKSFVNGFFRESCGVDAFGGINVTPQRVRKPFPTGARGSVSLLSWSAYADGLATRGYEDAAEYIYTQLEALLGFKLPYGTRGCGYVCRVVEDAVEATVKNHRMALTGRIRMRFHEAPHPSPSYQRFEVRALRPVKPRVPTSLDGWDRYLRNLTMPQDDPDASSLRDDVSVLRPRWCAI